RTTPEQAAQDPLASPSHRRACLSGADNEDSVIPAERIAATAGEQLAVLNTEMPEDRFQGVSGPDRGAEDRQGMFAKGLLSRDSHGADLHQNSGSFRIASTTMAGSSVSMSMR